MGAVGGRGGPAQRLLRGGRMGDDVESADPGKEVDVCGGDHLVVLDDEHPDHLASARII